jgi:hypothetical protein
MRRRAVFLIMCSYTQLRGKENGRSFTAVRRAVRWKFLLQFMVKRASKELYVR